MKIAIMTQPLGKNYGGIMQAWALQQVLKRMGHESVTIDRQPDPKSVAYYAARLGYRTLNKAIGKRKAPINFERHLSTILQHTREFIDQNMTMSEPLNSTAKLKAHFQQQNYDAVIVGSDQTWRPRYSPNIANFFLDFLEGKKIERIAYAASFGVDKWEFNKEQTQQCHRLAQQFDVLSVREDSGIELCRKYLGVEASHALDPTLLLDKTDYESLIGPDQLKSKTEGIYTYFLDEKPETLALAMRVSEQLREPIYSCQTKYGTNQSISSGVEDYVMRDIKEWLAGFANARFVLTDSFHGVIFSIIFRKQFQLVTNVERGAARFSSLLSLTGYDKCLDSSVNNSTYEPEFRDLGEPKSEFIALRSNSLSLLRDSLK